MYAFIEGKVESAGADSIVIEAGGIGYIILCTASVLNSAVVHERMRVYTYLQVREDAMTLLGFYSIEEKKMFEKLIGVAGVGPKTALSVLSKLSPENIMAAVYAEDAAAFKGTGVGVKTAQKIMLEFKSSLNSMDMAAVQGTVPSEPAGRAQEAAAALVALGYGTQEALKSVSKVDATLPVEDIIKLALRSI